jgi:hypothetical protein
MSRESAGTPPQSAVDADEYGEGKAPSRSGVYSPKSQNGQILQDLAASPVSYEQKISGRPLDDDDIGSDVQQRSETPLPVVSVYCFVIFSTTQYSIYISLDPTIHLAHIMNPLALPSVILGNYLQMTIQHRIHSVATPTGKYVDLLVYVLFYSKHTL